MENQKIPERGEDITLEKAKGMLNLYPELVDIRVAVEADELFGERLCTVLKKHNYQKNLVFNYMESLVERGCSTKEVLDFLEHLGPDTLLNIQKLIERYRVDSQLQ